MNIIKAHNLACPIDGKKLEQADNQFVCESGHSFDIARQGYVNLLPVQHKRSKQPGDSKAMVLARTQFLNSGSYQTIANKLTETVLTHLVADKEVCLMDMGCGEGYYFDALFKAISSEKGTNAVSFVGLDISKDAIIQSSKRNKQISWLVGTNRQPPVADESVDIILCLFGFVCDQAFYNVLKPGGKIILVDPGEKHLKELREIIYPVVKKSDHLKLIKKEITGFDLLSTEELNFTLKINDSEKIEQLLLMTPHFYRATKEGREAVCRLNDLEVTVNVVFRVLEKI